jgi:hypothetical protein
MRRLRPLLLLGLLALGYVVGGAAPLRAATDDVRDAIARQLDKLTDALKGLFPLAK